jgi:hypothetical protein
MLPIATYDDRRFISQCEHGTLHMHWGRVMLSFHPDEFLLIARTLRRYDPDRRTDLASPGVSVFWQAPEQEAAQVWLAHAVGLLVVSLLVGGELLPWLAVPGMLLLIVRAGVGLHPSQHGVRTLIIGVQELGVSLLLVGLLAGGYLL